ncbi:MAG: aminoacyl-tRNA hydrolase [Clostridia bacterium]|nr:aminoacyl-tRNA hydrolase [Clostridia bacterium]
MADIFDLFKKIEAERKSASSNIEYIIVGLGNPGEKYARTRHNAGFLAIDYLSQKYSADVKQLKFKSLTGDVKIGEHRALLMKPQTFMNNSGEAVGEAAKFYKIAPENIIVIVDDIYQAPGRMRIRKNGSAGGHNGLKSIIEHLGADTFPRIKIGVGEKPNPEYELADWVLARIPKADEEPMFKIFEATADCIPMLLDGKTDDAMGKFNGLKF